MNVLAIMSVLFAFMGSHALRASEFSVIAQTPMMLPNIASLSLPPVPRHFVWDSQAIAASQRTINSTDQKNSSKANDDSILNKSRLDKILRILCMLDKRVEDASKVQKQMQEQINRIEHNVFYLTQLSKKAKQPGLVTQAIGSISSIDTVENSESSADLLCVAQSAAMQSAMTSAVSETHSSTK